MACGAAGAGWNAWYLFGVGYDELGEFAGYASLAGDQPQPLGGNHDRAVAGRRDDPFAYTCI
jgi:hypothetical protein